MRRRFEWALRGGLTMRKTMAMRRWRTVAQASAALAVLGLTVPAIAEPVPYSSLQPSDGRPSPAADPTPSPVGGTAVPYAAATPTLGSETSRLRDAIEAAKAGDTDRARAAQSTLSDPLARRIVTWAMIDSAASRLSFFELGAARRDLFGWPRAARRQAGAEKALETSGVSPQAVVSFFDGKEPETAEGALALASAYASLGRQDEAAALIRHVWRDRVFEADVQARMLARWGQVLTADDHARRLDILLYGSQGPAARAIMALVGPDLRAEAEARIALRGDRSDAPAYVDRVPATLQTDPGLAFERARYYRRRNLETVAVQYLRDLPSDLPPEVAAQIWPERRALMIAALRAGAPSDAHLDVASNGLKAGADFAEAEFFAGWIDLTRLHNPTEADQHFARVQDTGTSPITLARALYWRGRAAEARGDMTASQTFYRQGAQYLTAFYGQLAAEKAGIHTLTLGRDPEPTAEDRRRFASRDLVRAAEMLADAGERDLVRAFVLAQDDALPSAEEYALLVDFARRFGDQDLAMRVARGGAQRGFILPERAYPIVVPPTGAGLPEPAFSLAIMRQESNFDPSQRSSAGARGLMQLMPGTAATVARRIGVKFFTGRLNEAEYNMLIGTAYLGQVLNEEGGSYVLAAAAYNAGPGRAAQWAAQCGDPRGGTTAPEDFIECISISETRNYVMRILETTQVYRARLNGGSAPLDLAADLKRGGWTPGGGVTAGYSPGPQPYVPQPSPYAPPTAPPASGPSKR